MTEETNDVVAPVEETAAPAPAVEEKAEVEVPAQILPLIALKFTDVFITRSHSQSIEKSHTSYI